MSAQSTARMRVIAVCYVACWMLLVASSTADNIISRMLRQVLPGAVTGGGTKYNELNDDYGPTAFGEQFVDSNDINYVYRKPSRPTTPIRQEANKPPKMMTASESSNLPNGEGDTSGWNPFTWFAPKLHSIPYNPDTDLQTASIFKQCIFSFRYKKSLTSLQLAHIIAHINCPNCFQTGSSSHICNQPK